MFLQNKMFSRCSVFQAKQHIISYVKHCPLPYYIAPSDPSNATINLLFLHFTQLLRSLNPFYLSDELNKLLIKSRILKFYTVQKLAIPLRSLHYTRVRAKKTSNILMTWLLRGKRGCSVAFYVYFGKNCSFCSSLN